VIRETDRLIKALKEQEVLIGQLKQDIYRIKIDANVKVENLI